VNDRPHRRRDRIDINNINSIDLNVLTDEEIDQEIASLRLAQEVRRSDYAASLRAVGVARENLDETSRRLFRMERFKARRRAGDDSSEK